MSNSSYHAAGKKWGLKGLKALEPKKWGGLEPSSLIEVYAYEHGYRMFIYTSLLVYI